LRTGLINGKKTAVIATYDAIISKVGANWVTYLHPEKLEYDKVESVKIADIDGDGNDDVIVLTEGFLYGIRGTDGSIMFRRAFSMPSGYTEIFVEDVLPVTGKEILVASESAGLIYVFSSEGCYIGEIDLDLDGVEDMISADISNETGNELCILGYRHPYYYLMAINIMNFPAKNYKLLFNSSLDDFLIGNRPDGVVGRVYAFNLTEEEGLELIIGGVREDGSNVYVLVYNSSGKISSIWPSQVTLGQSSEWLYLNFSDINNDKRSEILVASHELVAIIRNVTSYKQLL